MASNLTVDTIRNSSGNTVLMEDGARQYISGEQIQMKYFQYTDTTTQAISADTSTVIGHMEVKITPKFANSIIHLQCHMFYEHGDNNNNSWNHVWFFYRDSTKLAHAAAGVRLVGISMGTLTYYGDDNASTAENARYDYFDQPATTDEITYKVGYHTDTAETLAFNKTVSDSNTNNFERGISFISATEYAA